MSGPGRRLRVIHCGTGIAGRQALKAILQSPQLELVGLLVHGEAYEGQRAAAIAGVESDSPVCATRDFAALCRLQADAVCYMLLTPDIEHITALLASGKNVVTTAGLMYPGARDAALAQRIDSACARGSSSFYVTGINPGFVDEILPLTMSVLCRRIEHVHVREYANCAKYPAPHILSVMGFGRSEDDVRCGRLPDLAIMRDFFTESIAALAHGLGLKLDDIRQTREFVYTDRAYSIAAGDIPAGGVAGQRWRWSGMVDGVERIAQETLWITAFDLGEGWPTQNEYEDDTQWRVTLEGTPSLRCTFEPRYSFVRDALSASAGVDFNPSGLATAMAAVNSLVPLAAARPGLLTSVDLPLPHARLF